MEFFTRAKVIRLRSQHNKYLVAAHDEDSVRQSRSGSSKSARWAVETVDNKPNVIRLKNCQSWKYLRATDDLFLLGMTGKQVSQCSPRPRLDQTIEWEPIKEGAHAKLRTRKGNFLRANSGLPPWNNSITHDAPSRNSSTQDWLWTVDVLEMDYQSTEPTAEIKESKVTNQASLSRNSSTGSSISKADYFKDCYEVGSPAMGGPEKTSSVDKVKQSNQEYRVDSDSGFDANTGSLYRYTSSGSTVSKADPYKDFSQNEVQSTPAAPKSVRSVRRHPVAKIPAESPKRNPKASKKPERVSPFGDHVRDESRSDSFNKLKSALDGLEDLLDDEDDESDTLSEPESELVVEPILHKPHALEVKMARHTLKELEGLDYETILSSGKDKKLEEAVNLLIADFKMTGRGQVPVELESLKDQLSGMKEEHTSATRDIEEYSSFTIKRLETKGKLKKDASKAHELETLEVGLSNIITDARARREDLLKQLEGVENTIKATEKAQADNALEIDELVSRIGEKSETLREMEKKEKSWQGRKFEAEMKLEKVEEDWVKMLNLLEDL